MMRCEICDEAKLCGMIRAYRWDVGERAWKQTSETIICADCAVPAGGVAAASVKSWVAKDAQKDASEKRT